MNRLELLQGFVTDNSDVAVAHMLSGYSETEEDISAFITEMQLEDMFYIYCQIMLQQ